VGFDYLTPGGNVTFYDLFLRDLTDQPLNEAFNTKMKSIRNLAPGDFKVVRDRYLFHPKKEITHEMLLDALETEAKLKSSHGNKKPIGF
jgi:transitional endoplasmic reticulum ATPase